MPLKQLTSNDIHKLRGKFSVFNQYLKNMNSGNTDKLSIPTLKSNVNLFKHQEDFARKFLANPNIVAAHGAGSGKTLSSIAATEALKSKAKNRKPTIIVAPASLRHNYKNEGVDMFTDRTAVIIGDKATTPNFYTEDMKDIPKADYYIMSYEAAKKIGDKLMNRVGADHLIADEAHYVKNVKSGNFEHIKNLRDKVNSSIFLTATPIKNKPEDLAILTSLAAGMNSKDMRLFKNIMSKSLVPVNEFKKQTGLKGLLGMKDYKDYHYDVNPKLKPVLQSVLKGYVDYLPGSKIENANFPEVSKDVVKVPMDSKQHLAYKYFLKQLPKDLLKKVEQDRPMSPSQASLLANRLIRPLQLSQSYSTFNSELPIEEIIANSSKMKKAISDAKEIWDNPELDDKRILFFTNQVEHGLKPLSEYFKKQGIPTGIFAGKGIVSEDERQKYFRDFMDKKLKALLVSSAGQAGISAKNVPYQFNLDFPLSIGGAQQQIARTIRSGSTLPEVKQKTYLATLPVKGKMSVDEWVHKLLERKEKAQSAIYNLL